MPNQQRLVALLAAACGYIIKFIACNFLTPTVLLSFAALVFTYINLVGPEVPFLRYFSFLLPIDGRGNASINEQDIMKAFGLLTMFFFLLSVIGGWLVRVFKRIFQSAEAGTDEKNASASQSPASSARCRLIPGSLVIVIIFLIVFISIPFARMAEGTSSLAMYPLFAVFGVIALVSNAIYIGVDTLSDVVLGWAWPRVLSTSNFNEELL